MSLLSRDYYFFPPDVSSVHKRHRLARHLVSVVTPHEPQLDQPYTSARNSACTQEREHALLPRVDSSRSHRHSLSILSACCSSAYFHRTEGTPARIFSSVIQRPTPLNAHPRKSGCRNWSFVNLRSSMTKINITNTAMKTQIHQSCPGACRKHRVSRLGD